MSVTRLAPALFALSAGVVLWGCGPSPESPVVRKVSPDWGWNGENTDIVVAGQRFYPEVVVGDERGEVQIDGSFRLFLGTSPETELESVERLDNGRLAAEVPSGLVAGTYDVRLLSPSGDSVALQAAFRVSDTKADHLAFQLDRVGYDVSEVASFFVYLADPDGQPVAESITVELSVTANGFPAQGIEFSDGLLTDQAPLSGGTGIRGALGPDGTSPVVLRSTIAQELTFTLTAPGDPNVHDATALLDFAPGLPDHIELNLPSPSFETEAGEPMDVDINVVDAAGNVIDATGLQVLLYEDGTGCGDFSELVDLLAEGPYSVTLTTACDVNTLRAVGVGVDAAESEPFAVRAAEIAGYSVRASPGSVVAAERLLAVQVQAVDAYANAVTDHTATLTLRDNVGGVDPDLGTGSQSCPAILDGATVCTAFPERAADLVQLTATDNFGYIGVSNPISVVAGDPAVVSVRVGVASVMAGDAFTVTVEVYDAVGNPTTFLPEDVGLSDLTGTLSCASDGVGGFSCAATQATTANTITASIGTLTGESAPFPVTNAAMSSATVSVSPTVLTAGDVATVIADVVDAFGNPYVTAVSGYAVSVENALGGLVLTLPIDATGRASGSATLTRAGVDMLAVANGATLGTSGGVTVLPGDGSALVITAVPWVAVGEPLSVVVEVVDSFGNVDTAWTDTVEVAMVGCDGDTAAAVAGRAELATTCSGVGLSKSLTASSGSLAGSAKVVDVLDFECATGPVPELLVDGAETATVCLVSDVAEVSVDTSGSSAGSASLAIWHLHDGAESTRSAAEPTLASFEGAGARRLALTLADSDACAATAEAVVWVGTDDGSPSGPLSVVASASTVSTSGSVDVDVTALDCAGLPAVGGDLHVRADLGTLHGVTASGQGLTLSLDGSGAGAFTWEFNAGYAAQAVVTAAGEVSFGTATVTTTGDTVAPYVTSVDPTGSTSGTVSEISLTFSEPLQGASLTTSNLTISGPSGSVAFTVEVGNPSNSVVLTPTSALAAGTGTFAVGVSSAVRDAAGNRLSGDWSGSPAAWSGTFGALSSSLPSGFCTLSDTSFQPDGDDSLDADAVTFGLSPSASPAWWQLQVVDADGDIDRTAFISGLDTTLTWDGRGDDGRVLGAGVYTLWVNAVDGYGNVGAFCEGEVSVTQFAVAP